MNQIVVAFFLDVRTLILLILFQDLRDLFSQFGEKLIAYMSGVGIQSSRHALFCDQ